MSISEINSNIFFNPTIGTAQDTTTSNVSNADVFFNPSVGEKLPTTDSYIPDSKNSIKLESEVHNYELTKILFSAEPLNSITPAFDVKEQANIMNKVSNYNLLSPELLESAYSNATPNDISSYFDSAA